MWWFPFLLGSPSAPITFPRARRPLLICMLSFSLSPVLPVLKMRSEPAKRKLPRLCLAVFPDSSKLNTSSRPSTTHSLTPQSTRQIDMRTKTKKKVIKERFKIFTTTIKLIHCPKHSYNVHKKSQAECLKSVALIVPHFHHRIIAID
uniref:Uncharacterized protein n=1 Tax=Hippocampus comes TaxID=109280 RepID=A0A3Q2XTJ6_HIPCM